MNMISTGAFQTEMDASNKQSTLAKKFVAVWEKKNAKAARAGGVSLMALSLAACGSDDATTTTTTTTDTTTTDTTTTTVVTAKTMVLTTGVDIAPDYTGTTADDTYIADNTSGATANVNTLNASDELDGGAGTDTLKIYSDGDGDVTGVLSNIENIMIHDLDDTFDLTDITGISTVTVVRGDGTQVIKVDAGETVNLENFALSSTNGATDVSLDFGATATSASFGVNKIVAGTTAARDDITLTGAKLTTVDISATGTASVIQVLDVAAAKTVNIDAAVKLTTTNLATTATLGTLDVDGAGAVVLGTMDAGFTTIDASGNSGGVTFAINNDDTIVTGGSGADTITASATDALATTDKLAVDAGAGTDTLVLGDAADVNTAADAARYTNFETLSVVASQDVSIVGGITAVSVNGDSVALTNMNATNAAAITVTSGGGDTTATALSAALATATGTADVISITTKSATATTDVDLANLDVDNFETMNFIASTGTNTSGDTALDFAANKADELAALNISGTADVTLTVDANVMDVVAVTIDASQLTGTADFTLADNSGTLIAGTKVIGTANGDTFGIQANEGMTVEGGAGNDGFTSAVATINADGSTDTVLDGGAGTDTLTISDTSATLIDTHFTNIKNMEKLTTSTGDTSITMSAAGNTAFGSGITVTSGTITDSKDFAFNGGLISVAATVTVDATSAVANAAGEDYIVTTGSGADTITVTGDTTMVGSTNADGGSIVISAGAGADTISFAYGTVTAQTTSQIATVTGGTGKDTISKTAGTNGTTTAAVTDFVIADGDSLTSAYDVITGFDMAVATGSLLSDVLDLSGGTVATAMTTVDFGTIMSHNISNGMATFDDVAAHSAALKITSANLDDVIGYLKANVTVNNSIGFLYDKNADGTNDGTMVFSQGTLDTLVHLDVITGAGLTATATTTTDNFIAIA